MSLINDALKRAKEAQASQPPPPLQGAPLHPTQAAARPNRALLIALLVLPVIAGIAGLVIWKGIRRPTAPLQTTTTKASALSAEVVPKPAAAVSSPNSASAPASSPIPADAAAKTTSPAAPPPTALANPETNAPGVAAGGPPAAPAFKLQGIFYRPGNPSAVINGKTVFVGDRVGEARVVAIGRQDVTLILNGQTNVMILPER